MSNELQEHGKIIGISAGYFWIGLGTLIASTTLVLAMRPTWLGMEREAFVESHQYIESHRDKLLTDISKYDELGSEIAKYEEDGGHDKIVSGLKMQKKSLSSRIRDSLSKIPAEHHPENVKRFQ